MNRSPEVTPNDVNQANTLVTLEVCQAPTVKESCFDTREQTPSATNDTQLSTLPEQQQQQIRENDPTPAPSIHASSTKPRSFILNIVEHPQSELLVMLSSLLSKITHSNDNLHNEHLTLTPPKPDSPWLAFHARNIPSISIQSYLTRILKYCPMSSDIFLSLLVYFDRMSQAPAQSTTSSNSDAFTSTKQLLGDGHHPFTIDSYNVHRLVITGIVVASKFCSDVFYTNSRYAKVGGLPLHELNHLEFQFLLINDFRLMISVEELQKYGNQLLEFWHNE